MKANWDWHRYTDSYTHTLESTPDPSHYKIICQTFAQPIGDSSMLMASYIKSHLSLLSRLFLSLGEFWRVASWFAWDLTVDNKVDVLNNKLAIQVSFLTINWPYRFHSKPSLFKICLLHQFLKCGVDSWS